MGGAKVTKAGRLKAGSAGDRVASVTLVLRGLLAERSGNDDDPFVPGILVARRGARSRGADSKPDISAKSPGELDRAVRQYAARHGHLPGSARVCGLADFRVIRETPDRMLPLRNKTALVTGAAGAIGAGICRGLLEKGCHVAASDISRGSLDSLVRELGSDFRGRIIGVKMDVGGPGSVARGFGEVIKAWGGLDIVVANAGVAAVAGLTELDIADFRRLERVNAEGTLLTIAEAGRCMRKQGIGGDIVVISTKNVFAPGAQFGAYSATKAACHQLGRIASLELAPFGIRVNMVAPDAVFSDGSRKSGLWAEVGPSRMKARGLDEAGLMEYYRGRNLLKVRVTAAHVANAVLFFVTRQTPTTGATIPVDGGLPDATPR